MRTESLSKFEATIILMLAVLFLTQSCVSRKKFVEISNQRTVAEKRVIVLHEENDILKSDFDNLKNESQIELAQKQHLIDSLRFTIASLNTDMISEKDNIQDQTFSFQLETGKLTQQLAERDKDIRNLTREVNTLKIQVDDLNRELDNAKSGFKFPFGNVKQLERKIQSKDKEITFLDSCLTQAKDEVLILNEKIDSQTIVIEKLISARDSLSLNIIQP